MRFTLTADLTVDGRHAGMPFGDSLILDQKHGPLARQIEGGILDDHRDQTAD